MSEAIIRIEGLVKAYPGVTALKNLNLEIPKGSIVGLLGPNGSGKSTLLKLIAGFCQPTRGKVEVFGRPVDRQSKKHIAFLPELNHFYKWMTVKETIDFWSQFYENWDSEIAEDLLGFMNLRPEAKVKTLSKGMKARLKLIVTLARKASVVLLDEPFSGIDPQSRGRIMDAITSKYDFGEQTLIISTHDVLEAEQMFDKVILLEFGDIKIYADADELREKYNDSIHGLLKEVFE
ncbi:MAG: ABC transporter ATP-binding protein [Halanaerobiales bacterium]|nr:ABC transporter ATP-binding protein [Halanaerobiales bacterium]